jgi:hypothetical protein
MFEIRRVGTVPGRTLYESVNNLLIFPFGTSLWSGIDWTEPTAPLVHILWYRNTVVGNGRGVDELQTIPRLIARVPRDCDSALCSGFTRGYEPWERAWVEWEHKSMFRSNGCKSMHNIHSRSPGTYFLTTLVTSKSLNFLNINSTFAPSYV